MHAIPNLLYKDFQLAIELEKHFPHKLEVGNDIEFSEHYIISRCTAPLSIFKAIQWGSKTIWQSSGRMQALGLLVF
jgi:hypothetical protein